MLPFSAEQFHAIFRTYNEDLWPVHVAMYGLALFALALLLRRDAAADRIITSLLSGMWLWTGVVYHWIYFFPVNGAALLFGAMFVAQGSLLAAHAWSNDLQYCVRSGPRGVVAVLLVCYSAVAYPLIGLALGAAYSDLPLFGVTPCPVTIFTLGVLLLVEDRPPTSVLVAPLIWSIVGGSAALLLNVPQDWVLLLSGPLALAVIYRGRVRR